MFHCSRLPQSNVYTPPRFGNQWFTHTDTPSRVRLEILRNFIRPNNAGRPLKTIVIKSSAAAAVVRGSFRFERFRGDSADVLIYGDFQWGREVIPLFPVGRPNTAGAFRHVRPRSVRETNEKRR